MRGPASGKFEAMKESCARHRGGHGAWQRRVKWPTPDSTFERPRGGSKVGPRTRLELGDVLRGHVAAWAHLGRGDHLGPIDQDEVIAADDPAIGEGAGRDIRDRDETRVRRIDEAG